MHISFLFFLLQRRKWVIYLHTSFGFPSLAIIYIGIHMKKARILAYWLSKKEKREVKLTEVTQQFLTHHSCPELPRGTGGDYKWVCNALLTPFTGPTTFNVLLLIRKKKKLNLDLLIVVSSISPSVGLSEKGNCPV